MKNTKLAVSLLAVALALGGCGKEAPKADKSAGAGKAPAAGATEVKIGHVGPLTGGIAHPAQGNQNRAPVAVGEAQTPRVENDGKDGELSPVAQDHPAH